MGTVVGAIASGNVPAGGNGDAFSSWIEPCRCSPGPSSCAQRRIPGGGLPGQRLAAGRRRASLEDYFARRALAAALVAGAVAVAGIIALHADARYVYDGLTTDGLPLVIVSALCGLGVVALLLRCGRARQACARSPPAPSSR